MTPGDLSLEKRLDRIEAKLDVLLVDVVTLKTKAAIWGSAGGGLLALFIVLLEKVL